MKHNHFDKITLIIPTYNRHQYLKRILDYYSGSEIKIVVCDSSVEPFSTSNYPNVTYYQFKEYQFTSKINACLNKIDTPYTIFCADDDFIILDSVKKGIDFLNKNPDYASVGGKLEAFYNLNKKIVYQYYPKIRAIDILPEKATERLKKRPIGSNTFNNYFYCVHRTANLKQIFDFAHKNLNEIDLAILNEYFLSFVTTINGKHKVLPTLLNIMEFHPDSAGYKAVPVYRLASNEEYKKKCDLVLNHCIICLKNKENISTKEAEKAIMGAWSSLISNNIKLNRYFLKKIVKIVNLFPSFKEKLQILHFLLTNWKNALFSNYLTLREYDDAEIKNIKKVEFFIKKHNI